MLLAGPTTGYKILHNPCQAGEGSLYGEGVRRGVGVCVWRKVTESHVRPPVGCRSFQMPKHPGPESGGRGRATWETFHSFTFPLHPTTHPTPLAIVSSLPVSPSPFPPRAPAPSHSISHHLISTCLYTPGVFPLPQLPLTQTGGLPLDFRENHIP